MSSTDQPSGRERIFAAALETLERDGEAALRFVDIAGRAGVALSVITHHFATREGLVKALHEHRYGGLVARDEEVLRRIAETAKDRRETAGAIATITAEIVDRSRADVRLARIVSIGAMHGRPDLAGTIRQAATALLDTLTDVVVTGQRNGLIDPEVDARALATFIHAYAVGMIVADLDETPASREALVGVIARAIDAFQSDPDVRNGDRTGS
jgi:AcrR family transcriptional regulator